MSTPILATKLYIPPPRPKAVQRTRLITRLAEATNVTLISAPAGFGKTTLVSEWAASGKGHRVAWLALDEGDNEPTRFLAYVIAALQTVAAPLKGKAATIGTEALGVLQMSPPPPIESILTTLINEISTLPDPLVLVLDDYHVIEAKATNEALKSTNGAVGFLLEHLPLQLHLVITTREDPQLPLARLRARGQLTELRAADLRFTAAEATEFLNTMMGLSLSVADVAALEERTEGWIAGLQLAALSMQGQKDVSGFIRAFAGDHRYIVDYLVEEVLQQQPEAVRNFLLQTAILGQLNGSLCEAVTGLERGNARLEALERGNFFVVALDDKRQWYRYHHLFGEVLLTHLMTERRDEVPGLHLRASEWYEQHGLMGEAVQHALAAKDFARVATLVERGIPDLRRNRQETKMLSWLKALPDEVIRDRPVLSTHYAGALLSNGELESVEGRLRDAERWLNPAVAATRAEPNQTMIVVDEEEFRGLASSIAIFRMAMALALGKVDDTMLHARQVLALVPEDDHIRRGSAEGFLAIGHWTNGDLEAAHQWWTACMTSLQQAGYIADAIGVAIALADIRITQGRLREALRTFERGLKLSLEQGEPVLRGTADMHVGISALDRERNDLKAAMEHLLRSKELGDLVGLRQNPYRWRVAMARLREAEGNIEGALDLLDEAERLYVSDFYPNVRPIAALKARAWVAQGRFGEALGWAREKGLSVEDDLSYLREFEHMTLARILLAQSKRDGTDGSLPEAMGLLARLLKAADEGGRTGHVIEILILQALVYQEQDDVVAALAPLGRALRLAEPESYVRVFVDEGSPMVDLLEKAAKEGIAPSYVQELLAAFGKAEETVPVKQALIEPLSERELEVLKLLRTDLSGPEIARELSVSLSTLRTHTQNIFSKLEVNNRRAAVRRADQLGL